MLGETCRANTLFDIANPFDCVETGSAGTPRTRHETVESHFTGVGGFPAAIRVQVGSLCNQPHHSAAQAQPATAVVSASGSGDGVDSRLKAAATSAPTRN